MKRCKGIFLLAVVTVVIMFAAACGNEGLTGSALEEPDMDYSNIDNWICFDEGDKKEADVFFLAPTVYSGSEDELRINTVDRNVIEKFENSVRRKIGVYEENCRVYAPVYRQATLYSYRMDSEIMEDTLKVAYKDVSDAFSYYINNINTEGPFILAGFSQGSDMLIRLMKEYFDDETLRDRLIVAYAIGWRLTEEECAEYPQLQAAQGEFDTGVIVTFNSEAEYITDSVIVPEGAKTLSINPLNWKTDSTAAMPALNKGACFVDVNGYMESEIPRLCGCYIDDLRGTLKVTGVSASEYPAVVDLYIDGVYHVYDYSFFYRNIEENVNARINAYMDAQSKQAA